MFDAGYRRALVDPVRTFGSVALTVESILSKSVAGDARNGKSRPNANFLHGRARTERRSRDVVRT